MTALSDLRPTSKQRLIDLVKKAGVDVGDWSKGKGGKKRASVNPKYCYEWAFVEAGKVVVLNIWHSAMKNVGGRIVQRHNFRESAKIYSRPSYRPVWKRRALKADEALRHAATLNLPVKIIVLAGYQRDRDDPYADASRVDARLLDSVPWRVTKYDVGTGECTLTRGAKPSKFADQFAVPEDPDALPEKHASTKMAYVRNADVRARVLERASGKCEWCSEPGFEMNDGRIFLETHHVIPLSAGGADSFRNVAALCANHHREAHYGSKSKEMRAELLKRIARKLK